MFELSRRQFAATTAFAAALGLGARLVVPVRAQAQSKAPEMGFHKYKIGSVEVTAIYDGMWAKPHDPAFIRNASIDETKEALAKALLPSEFVPIPLTVTVLTIGGKHILIDAGSGAQWQSTAQGVRNGMQASGIDPASISKVLISHFHPDHIFGLMEAGSNKPVYPNAELVVSATEYKWWTEPGRVEKLPEARKALGQRINAVFSTWKNFTLVDGEKEVAPGVRMVSAPGHTPGHSAFHLSSGNDQLMLSNDVAYVPALLAPHPDWQGTYDQDGPLAVATRRNLLDRVVAEKMKICGAHFPFPGSGSFAKDGDGYAFVPTVL